MEKVQIQHKTCWTVQEAAEMTGLSYTCIADWAETDSSFPVFAQGKKRVIPRVPFELWLAQRAELRTGMTVVPESIKNIRRRRKEAAPRIDDQRFFL